jgi:hypothetical protein
MDTRNIEPNDEREVAREVRAERRRSAGLDEGRWLAEVRMDLEARLSVERATVEERAALAAALRDGDSEPSVTLRTCLTVRRPPRDAALLLAAWVVRRRRAARVAARAA